MDNSIFDLLTTLSERNPTSRKLKSFLNKPTLFQEASIARQKKLIADYQSLQRYISERESIFQLSPKEEFLLNSHYKILNDVLVYLEQKPTNLLDGTVSSESIKNPHRLDSYTHNNSKVSRLISDGIIDFDEEAQISVSGRRGHENLTTSCVLSNEFYNTGYLEFQNRQPTPFDKEVYDAICSHYDVGNTNLTINMIYRAMLGKTGTQKPTEQQAQAIADSIRKMGCTRVKIDCTEELKARGMDLKYAKLDSISLDFRVLEGESQGGQFAIYNFRSEPILFTYAKAIRQIISIPLEYLDTPSNNSEDLLVVKKYLLARILNMKSSRNKVYQETIVLENIYKIFRATDKRSKQKVRYKIEPLLDHWISIGLFGSYEYVRDGKTTHSIKINFTKQKSLPPSL